VVSGQWSSVKRATKQHRVPISITRTTTITKCNGRTGTTTKLDGSTLQGKARPEARAPPGMRARTEDGGPTTDDRRPKAVMSVARRAGRQPGRPRSPVQLTGTVTKLDGSTLEEPEVGQAARHTLANPEIGQDVRHTLRGGREQIRTGNDTARYRSIAKAGEATLERLMCANPRTGHGWVTQRDPPL
jgi:hypothetical protein